MDFGELKSLIYISYALKDKKFAQEIRSLLQQNGCGVFLDDGISPGDEWASGIMEKIELCDVFISLISENYVLSRYCVSELHSAVNLKKRIIPIYVEETRLPDSMQLLLGSCISLNKYGVGFEEKLLTALGIEGAVVQTETITERAVEPYEGDKPFIFASYSHKNTDEVLKVISALQQRGYRVWYDEGIDPGTEWADFIASQIDKCGYFIAFMSREYLDSTNCLDELEYVRDMKTDRLLVYLTDITLSGGLKMRHGRLQAVHKYKYKSLDEFMNKLLSTPALYRFKD